MALWLSHLKLSFGGTIGDPALEEWSNTVKFKIGDDDSPLVTSLEPDPHDLDEMLGACNAPLQKWITSEGAKISAQARLTWAKLNYINPSGRQRDTNTHRIDTGVVAGSVGNPVPNWFTTAALTLRTDLARGPGHSGRIFPPLVNVAPVGGSPYFADAVATGMATAFATCLNELSAAIRDNFSTADVIADVYPVVAHASNNLPGGFDVPTLQRITGVVVDRVADVQHSRTRQVPRVEGNRLPVAGA